MKKSLGRKTLVYPHPVFVIGSYDENDNPNLMAASWSGICCSDPPCIGVSVRKIRKTYSNIIKSNAFSVGIPSIDKIKEVDYCGIHSGKDKDKIQDTGLTVTKSDLANVPIIEEFPITLVCSLYKTIELGVHIQFVGEILDVLADEKVLGADGLPILGLVNTFCYDSASRFYYGTGEKLIKAYTTITLD